MANQPPQSFANHTKWDPMWHFFVFPVMLLNALYQIWVVFRAPGIDSFWSLLVAAALLITVFLGRVYPLKVQDRVIRLEERLRMRELLTPAEYERALPLSEKHLVALRFASDAELPALVAETLDKNLSPKQIKERIKTWRPDYHRV